MTIFRSFIHASEDTGELDASRVLSRDCYLAWLEHHKQSESPQKAKRFQRTLSNHLSGVDGRLPFPPQEEAAILVLVRRKARWPCFPSDVCVGFTGFRSLGFHEKAASSAFTIKYSRNRFKQRIAGLDGNRLQDGEFALNFASKAHEYATRLPEYDLSAYVYLGSLLRYVFFARTAACALRHLATRDTARELCDSLSSGDCVVVLSLSSPDPTTSPVLAQNASAFDWLGNVSDSLHARVPVPVNNVYGVMLAICTAMHAPGSAVPFVDIQFASLVPGTHFSGSFAFDPGSHLLVLRARPSERIAPS